MQNEDLIRISLEVKTQTPPSPLNIYYLVTIKLPLITLLGWGATDNTGEQSQFLRQVDLGFNQTTDCDCKYRFILETNVGQDNEDTCSGDSGPTI